MQNDEYMHQALSVLKKYYGYDSFRRGQWEIINNVCRGRDTLVLMPTGGGKSLCYQIPAMMMPGCAIIVSPLIALMQDQVLALKANGLPADAVNSNLPEYHNRQVMEDVFTGKVKILYISPERLVAHMQSWPPTFKISLFAIDEAHCISQWGHDFRPLYTSLSMIRDIYPDTPLLALTATADRLTREDIVKHLRLRDPMIYISSFDRPNIHMEVMEDPGQRTRLRIIESLIAQHPNDSGIVYCMTRKGTEEMHKYLLQRGIRTTCYHAGLSPESRNKAQKEFINGDCQVVCATIAFGMGIDKSNIRWVVHNNLPANIESYYQEIGRAGRDGEEATALMFYSISDLMTRRYLIDQNEGDTKEIQLKKLQRMLDFAQANVCRRRMLLSYFSEEMGHDCHNCDICSNPPTRFDGTELAQKAISAVIRSRQNIGITTLIDILRGNMSRSVANNGYQHLKTFGIGRNIPQRSWQAIISQLIQLGVLDPALEDYNHLRVTPYGYKVLKGDKIELSNFASTTRHIGNIKEEKPLLSPTEQLFEQLKTVRKQVANKEGVPAYIVFSDASLRDMAEKHPVTLDEFCKVSGVGERKAVQYGKNFVAAIRKFDGLGKDDTIGQSLKETLLLHNAGVPLEEICRIKKIKPVTALGHIVKLADLDLINNFSPYIDKHEYIEIIDLVNRSSEDEEAKETLYKQYDSAKVQLCKAIGRYVNREREKKSSDKQ